MKTDNNINNGRSAAKPEPQFQLQVETMNTNEKKNSNKNSIINKAKVLFEQTLFLVKIVDVITEGGGDRSGLTDGWIDRQTDLVKKKTIQKCIER